jgi:hypothetical protein
MERTYIYLFLLNVIIVPILLQLKCIYFIISYLFLLNVIIVPILLQLKCIYFIISFFVVQCSLSL